MICYSTQEMFALKAMHCPQQTINAKGGSVDQLVVHQLVDQKVCSSNPNSVEKESSSLFPPVLELWAVEF